MIDYYLKAQNKAALYAALQEAGMMEMVEGKPTLHPSVYMDEIGVITVYEDSPTPDPMDPAKGQTKSTLPGYHANIRLTEPVGDASKLPVIEEPDRPYRVWLDMVPPEPEAPPEAP